LLASWWLIFHGLGKHSENAFSGIICPASDPRALIKGFFPSMPGAHLAEPERVSPALERPNRVNPAALIKEPAGAVRFLDNAEPGCYRPQMHPGQTGDGHFQKISQNPDFRSADADVAGISRAAGAAAPAFKANPGVKKIPAMILFVRVAFHMGFVL
jgi:hypothetical protein